LPSSPGRAISQLLQRARVRRVHHLLDLLRHRRSFLADPARRPTPNTAHHLEHFHRAVRQRQLRPQLHQANSREPSRQRRGRLPALACIPKIIATVIASAGNATKPTDSHHAVKMRHSDS
jgi:hypothetical protein